MIPIMRRALMRGYSFDGEENPTGFLVFWKLTF